MPYNRESVNRVKDLVDWARENQDESSLEDLFREARRRWGHPIMSPMPRYVKRAFLLLRYNTC